MNSDRHVVECTIPVLPVADLLASIDFYTRRLGFLLDWRTDEFGSVSRDDHHIMLAQVTSGSGTGRVWIGLETDALFEDFQQRGVHVLQQPRNFSWAYETKFSDPDGNVLWLGTESRTDLPVADRKSD